MTKNSFIRFRTPEGTTDAMRHCLARKIIADGGVKKSDLFTTDSKNWRSCKHIANAQWKSNGRQSFTVDRLFYDESFYNEMVQKVGNNLVSQREILGITDFVAHYTCYTPSDDDCEFVQYQLYMAKHCLAFQIAGITEQNVKSTSALRLYTPSRTYVSEPGGKGTLFTENAKKLDEAPSLEYLHQRRHSGSSNEIQVIATVQLSSQSKIVKFRIRNAIVNRVLNTSLLMQQQPYSSARLFEENDEAVFFDGKQVFNQAGNCASLKITGLSSTTYQTFTDSIKSTKGIVYIFENDSYPGLVKIGKTSKSVSLRLSQLNTTGVPCPFRCAYAAFVEDMSKVESLLHDKFKQYRVNSQREFFKIDARSVHRELSKYAVGDATFT